MNSVKELRAATAHGAGAPQGKTGADKVAGPAPDRSGALGKLVLALAVGLSLGIALDRFVLPHQAVPAAEPAAAAASQPQAAATPLATGAFIQPDPNNPLHRGAGSVSVTDGQVVLGADFTVTPGPDYRVLLVPKPAIRAASDVAKTMYVDLGPLTAFKGGQHYAVPAGVDLADYPSVVIWCAPYAALISTADLSFAKAAS